MFQPTYHVSVSPTDGNGPTQGQRKTLTRVILHQTRTEEEIDQLLHDKRSKSTNKATDNAKSKIWTKANLANLLTSRTQQNRP